MHFSVLIDVDAIKKELADDEYPSAIEDQTLEEMGAKITGEEPATKYCFYTLSHPKAVKS